MKEEGLDGCKSGRRERAGDGAAWIGKWDEGERRKRGRMDGGVQ